MYKRKESAPAGSKPKRARYPRKDVIPKNPRLRYSMMSYKRKFFLENWAPNTTTTGGFWRRYNLSLSNYPNVAEIVALFDQYKITSIKLEFYPRYDNFSGNDTTDTALPGITNQSGTNMHVCYDTYSTVNPAGGYSSATCNNFLELGRVKSYRGIEPVTVFYKPAIVTESITDKFKPPQWLPTSNTAVTHWGPQVFMQDVNFNGSFGQTFDVFATMYTQVRNMK